MTLIWLLKIKHKIFGHPADWSTKTTTGYYCLVCGVSFTSRKDLYK